MKRYFYTDALAAAWMAKHFGMKFLHPDNENFPALTLSDAVDVFMNASEGDRLYIHPDCAQQLEPQVGDVVLNPDVDVARVVNNTLPKHLDFHVPLVLAQYWVGKEATVIQRSGMAFHWPEVEA